jgi:hypothetical protein
MEGTTLVNIKMTRKTAMESTYGLMAECTKVAGMTASSMALAFLSQVKVRLADLASGKKVKESNGSKTKISKMI